MEKIPPLFLPDQDGKITEPFTQKARFVVLFFYPKDNTPGCTTESIEFSELLSQFKAAHAAVYGISGGTVASKKKFCTLQKLTVPLLADSDLAFSTALGIYGEKKFMGRLVNGIKRTTLVCSIDGTLLKRFDGVKAKGHAQIVLNFIKTLAK